MSDLLNFVEDTKKVYYKIFEKYPSYISYAPGRVNLIGEHIDYNDGFVLPIAVPLYTVVMGEENSTGNTIRIRSMNITDDGDILLNLSDKFIRNVNSNWINYLIGILDSVSKLTKLPAFTVLINSNIPMGAGLSSSAALEVAFFKFVEQLCPSLKNLLSLDHIMICQKSEREFAGVPCGLMDQFVSFKGKRDHALFLDCRSLIAKLVPFFSNDISVLVVDSKIKHNLADGEYAKRRRQCLEAAKLLQKRSLRDANFEDLKMLMNLNIDEIVLKRFRHVLTETKRTQLAVKFLEKRDFEAFGRLMTESHQSLKNDYEVSCPEIDFIVEILLKINGVYGSRITGGGFGGCIVSLVQNKRIDEIIGELRRLIKFPIEIYCFKPCNGAAALNV